MTRARDQAGGKFSTADNLVNITLESTDADANVGPNLDLHRNSSSPADNDLAGRIQFNSGNDNSQDVTYSEMYITTPDVSDGSEDGQLHIDTMVAGTSRSRVKLTPSETVFNENSIDLDFRVESDNDANALFVQGADGKVGIGASSLSQRLDVQESTINTGMLVYNTNTTSGASVPIFLASESDGSTTNVSIENAYADSTAGNLIVRTGATTKAGYGTERMRIENDGSMRLQNASGNAVIGLVSGSGDMYLGGGTNSPSDMFLQTGGNTALSIDATGAVTKPLQPAFLAQPASQQNNIATGGVTVVWGTEIFDQGGDFASNTFTAPVTGKYQLSVVLRLDNIDAASDYYRIDIQTSNRQYYFLFEADLGTSAGQDITRYPAAMSILADMDANDTAIVSILQNNGTAQTDIITDSYFSGFLAC